MGLCACWVGGGMAAVAPARRWDSAFDDGTYSRRSHPGMRIRSHWRIQATSQFLEVRSLAKSKVRSYVERPTLVSCASPGALFVHTNGTQVGTPVRSHLPLSKTFSASSSNCSVGRAGFSQESNSVSCNRSDSIVSAVSSAQYSVQSLIYPRGSELARSRPSFCIN